MLQHIPSSVLPTIVTIAKQELARLKAIHEAVGDDWPADFDANDIPIFDYILSDLAVYDEQTETFDCGGKPLQFLCDAINVYVAENMHDLPFAVYEALSEFWSRAPRKFHPSFPPFENGNRA